MGSSKKIASGVAWTIIINIVNGAYGFVSVPILIAYFGKSDYGLIGLAMSINVYLRLLDIGFNSTNVRYFSNWLAKKDYYKVNKLFQTSLSFYGFLGLLNAIVLLLVSVFSYSFFNVTPQQDIIIKHLFYILSISALISWYTSCFEQLVRANECVAWVQKMMLLPKMTQIIILILTVSIGFEIEWYYGLTAASMFVIVPFMIRKLKKICPYVSFIPSFDKAIFHEVLPYSLNIFSFGIFQFSAVQLRPVLLGIRSTPDSITDYNVLNGIISVVSLIGGAFMGVFLPSASKVVADKNKGAQQMIAYRGTKFISITICFCCFGMMTISEEILAVYVGEDYLNLTFWLNIWLLATLSTHNQAISSLILAGTNIRAITYSTITASVLGLALTWWLIPIYNVGATVIGYLAYCLIQLLFYYLYYWPRVMNIDSKKVFTQSFAPFFILGCTLCFGINGIYVENDNVWLTLIFKGTIFSLIYILLAFILLGEQDRLFAMNIIKKK